MRIFPATSIILALGMEPNREVFDSLKGSCAELYNVGDSAKAGQVVDAIFSGFRAAREI